MTQASILDWVRGAHSGLDIPAHPQALLAGGGAFLRRAFRSSGVLAADNRVTRIASLDAWTLGGTGVKAVLEVAYERDPPGLARRLFVKFCHNFQDKVRDGGRYHIPPEGRLANLSRAPDFPIAVPQCLFAHIAYDTLTGLIVTKCIAYGQGAVEPHHPKCMDHILPAPLRITRPWSRTLPGCRARTRRGTSGTSSRGCFDLERLIAQRGVTNADLLARRLGRLAEFVRAHPQLFEPHLTDPVFLERHCREPCWPASTRTKSGASYMPVPKWWRSAT